MTLWLAGLAAPLALALLVFSWFEAGTEIRVLCGGFAPGTSRERVEATLATGEYLRWRPDGPDGLSVSSPYDLGSTRCRVRFGPHGVTSAIVD